ncbi:unnamed protein product [Lymnaea stagnalis]|uniref:Methyltransferase FkbM domain-containing protein n=1 Tax=Lymnaea stagnalis TaxID=6523 RepID=A0AAV2IB20_LYMST
MKPTLRCRNVNVSLILPMIALMGLVYHITRDRDETVLVMGQERVPDTVEMEVRAAEDTRELHLDVNIVPSLPNPELAQPYDECMLLPESPRPGVHICPHPMANDSTISKVLKENELWEKKLIYAMDEVLKQDESLMLFDVGCNIGEYTLWAAALGRTVVSVEMLMENVLRLQMALKLSGLGDQVTIVNNPLYSDHRTLSITFMRHHLGASRLNVSKPFDVSHEDKTRTLELRTICIDDLTPLMRGRNVYLKMDIENTEQHALVCAHKFFHEVNVRVVQMEWHRRVPEESEPILNFMAAHGYVASFKGKEYSPVDLRKSMGNIDVFFLKKSLFQATG